ncbi:PfkB family carbohydrate kinase [Paracoccus sp. (in: a-proteobacteria)]|uniref:PfkB family carbohydrate kinase n=1 Tax=Paracoccus sp. TaxID=267 RepID=UPI0032201EF5
MSPMTRILCLGAMHWDIIGHSAQPLAPGDDVPGHIRQQPGGVALNVALALARLGQRVALLSVLGCDAPGEALIAEAAQRGVDTRWILRDGRLATGSYVAIESPQGLVAAVADTRALDAAGTAILAPLRDGSLGDATAPWQGTLVVDGNLSPEVLAAIACDPCLAAARLRIVPASPEKALRLRALIAHPGAILHLNRAEAEALAGRDLPRADRAAEAVLALGARRVLVTDGASLVADAAQGAPTLALTPPRVAAVRVTGAGDMFLSAHLAAEAGGADRPTALARALDAATLHVCGKDLP